MKRVSRQRRFPRSHQQLVIKGLSDLHEVFRFPVVLNRFLSREAARCFVNPPTASPATEEQRGVILACVQKRLHLFVRSLLTFWGCSFHLMPPCPCTRTDGDRHPLFLLSMKLQLRDGHGMACRVSLPAWPALHSFPAQKLFPTSIAFLALF